MDTFSETRTAGVAEQTATAFPYVARLWFNAFCVGAAQSLVLLLALILAGLFRWVLKGDPMVASWMPLLLAAWVLGAWVGRLLPGWGLGAVEELRRTVVILSIVFAGTTAMLFWGKVASETSRLTLTAGFLLSLVLVPLARARAKALLLQAGKWGCPTVIYGDSQTIPLVVRALREEPGLGYLPAGVYLDNQEASTHLEGLPVLGGILERTSLAPVAVVALPRLARESLTDLLEGPLSAYRKVIMVPDLQDAPSLWVKPRDFVGMLALEISINLLDPLARVTKRSMDLAVVVLSSPVWVPLGVLTAIGIWLEDRTNPFFFQERVGRGGRIFHTWKFRTMHPEAERILQEKLATDDALREEWQKNFKLRRDPRVTRIGRFLRRTSLDELPQFVNVLMGEMSLVGPRPLPAYHHQQLPERVRNLRHRVRPGVTGLWQVSGRSEAGHLGMARWDTYYVRNWSIWLDVVILFRTFRTVFTGHGAF